MTTFTTGPAASSYSDTSVVMDTTCYYRVHAENAVGYSVWPNVATLRVMQLPAAPTNLLARPLATSPAQARVNLSWTEAASSTVSGFTVQLATNSSFTAGLKTVTAPGFSRAYSFTALSRRTKYYVRIQTLNGSVTSSWLTANVTTP